MTRTENQIIVGYIDVTDGVIDVAPFNSWSTEDIVRLIHLADVELQERDYRERSNDDNYDII